MKGVQKRYRNIVFTLNNYSHTEYTDLLNHDAFKYIIIGKEVGESGTPHLQGYGEFKKQISLSTVKSINPRMHFEPRYSSQKQAIDYCKKDSNWIDRGIRKIQGERTDLLKIRDQIHRGASLRSVLLDNELTASQLKVIDTYFTYLEPKKRIKPNVVWFYGSTGTGKSKEAFSMSSEEETYLKHHTKWWNGIDDQETVILDDFTASQMRFSDLLRLFLLKLENLFILITRNALTLR